MTAPDPAELVTLRQRVADLERRELVAQAQCIAPGLAIPDGASDAEVRAIAVRTAHGVEAVDGASADEIKGMFRALVHLRGADAGCATARTPAPDLRH
jgi:hypothetical protein